MEERKTTITMEKIMNINYMNVIRQDPVCTRADAIFAILRALA